MSQVKFSLQVLSSLIFSNFEHAVLQLKTFHVLTRSKCSMSFAVCFGFEKFVDVFDSVVV